MNRLSDQQKYLNIIGLATRANKVTVGEDQILRDIQKGRAKLLLLANNIGPNSLKKLTDKSKFYQVPYRIVADRDELSHAIGQVGRVAIVITDKGFADKISSLLD